MKHPITIPIALLPAPLAPLHAADAPAKKPNALLIDCDDLNGYIEGFGDHPKSKTPNITRWRDSGVSSLHITSAPTAFPRARSEQGPRRQAGQGISEKKGCG